VFRASAWHAGTRNASLEGIRGIAIGLVIFYHAFGGAGANSVWTAPVAWLAASSWAGVDLFFALSGFLITGILLDTRGRPGYLRIFYMRRFLRIAPVYYSFLAALFLISRFHVRWQSIHLLWHVFYLSNVSMAVRDSGSLVSHLWSLSVEEQFYLIWPSFILVIWRPRRTMAVIAGLFFLLVAARQWFGLFSANNYVVYGILHLDGLLLGSALAVFHRCFPVPPRAGRRARAVLLATGSILAAELVRNHGLIWWQWRGLQYLNYSLIAVFGTALIALTLYTDAKSGINRILASRPLVTLGKYSYAMYILQTPVHAELDRLHLRPSGFGESLAYTVLVGGISFAGAVVSWHILEKRCIELKERWFSYKRRTASVPAVERLVSAIAPPERQMSRAAAAGN
jgi:peptidoglycan/LPS O-acetylase OafA/YrhL